MKVIEKKQEMGEITEKFKIGHENVSSQTFRPEIIKCSETNLSFIDIAGFRDTGGIMIDLVNCFIDKYLILQSKTIKILLPITKNEIED